MYSVCLSHLMVVNVLEVKRFRMQKQYRWDYQSFWVGHFHRRIQRPIGMYSHRSMRIWCYYRIFIVAFIWSHLLRNHDVCELRPDLVTARVGGKAGGYFDRAVRIGIDFRLWIRRRNSFLTSSGRAHIRSLESRFIMRNEYLRGFKIS